MTIPLPETLLYRSKLLRLYSCIAYFCCLFVLDVEVVIIMFYFIVSLEDGQGTLTLLGPVPDTPVQQYIHVRINNPS